MTVETWWTTIGARALLVAVGITTRNKKLLETSASLLVTSALLVVTRTLLGAPGLTSSNKKLLVARCLTTSNRKRY